MVNFVLCEFNPNGKHLLLEYCEDIEKTKDMLCDSSSVANTGLTFVKIHLCRVPLPQASTQA